MASMGDRHVTVNQMVLQFMKQKAAIGQTTIYRYLEKLAGDGIIRKFSSGEGGACYQYAGGDAKCREHFHLICEKCGRLIHLDCELLDEIKTHLMQRHKFQINSLKTVFYGLCGKCYASRETP
jgi:Fur family ferric uptake transcriptional regulator